MEAAQGLLRGPLPQRPGTVPAAVHAGVQAGGLCADEFETSAHWPYEIPFWTIMPPRKERSNLLVAATPLGSHIGFSSLRMEPHFMVLGCSAGSVLGHMARHQSSGRGPGSYFPRRYPGSLYLPPLIHTGLHRLRRTVFLQ